MGLAIGDYDNDLDPDFYFTNIVNRMTLLQNEGDGTFVDATRGSRAGIGPTPVVGWGTAFFDYDNDGWLDLYVTTTQFVQPPYRGAQGLLVPPETLMDPFPDFLFRNNGDGTFTDSTPRRWLSDARPTLGIAYADYDNDGWVDFVLGEWDEGYALYRNTAAEAQSNGWLTVRLTGGGPVNRNAVGARVYLTSDDGRTQMQDVICGSSLGAGHDLALHFGLGTASVRQLHIVWPDGVENVFNNIPFNQIIHISYPDRLQTPATEEANT
jgi:hypothetical protein